MQTDWRFDLIQKFQLRYPWLKSSGSACPTGPRSQPQPQWTPRPVKCSSRRWHSLLRLRCSRHSRWWRKERHRRCHRSSHSHSHLHSHSRCRQESQCQEAPSSLAVTWQWGRLCHPGTVKFSPQDSCYCTFTACLPGVPELVTWSPFLRYCYSY
jgi:hypothetical protein